MARSTLNPLSLTGGFLRSRLLSFRREALILWFALWHRDTPIHLRLGAVAVGLYLLSPIDLIPIVVPFWGLVDDLVIVPLGVRLVAERLPPGVRAEADIKVAHWIERYFKRPLLALLVFALGLIALWIGLLFLLWRAVFG